MRWSFNYFDPPAALAFKQGDTEYLPGFPTYTAYNYAGGGVVARVKAAHFEAALKLTRDLHGQTGAVDFGCADGVLLPSLSRLFERVYAVDIRPDMTAIAERVRAELGLENVRVVCNRDRDFASLADEMEDRVPRGFPPRDVGARGRPESLVRIENGAPRRSIQSVAAQGASGDIRSKDGRPLVPRAAGHAAVLGMHREEIGRRELFNAVVRRNTDALEPGWTNSAHLGFNHLKLKRHLKEGFRLVTSRSVGFTQVFVVAKD